MRDEAFIRGRVPMTKSEVRAVTLDKLALRQDSVLYDIGAGTGSVSVEAALACPKGQVFAFEQKEEGCALIRQNADRFDAANVTVIGGRFPESLPEGLPAPDRVFVGGSGGAPEEMLTFIRERFPKARVVLNVIALETLARLTAFLKERAPEAEIVCVQVSRAETVGGFHLMKAQNPVYIFTLSGEAEK